MERFLWICLAGALGSGTRYLVGVWAVDRFGPVFPWGTIAVNLSGCFFIALVMELSTGLAGFPEGLRLALVTGFLGGLTTYSAFNYETTKLISEGPRLALANFGATTVGCLLAGALGLQLARRFVD
jgi:CrcB protein